MLYRSNVPGGSPVYSERVRWPKYSVLVNVYSLDYNGAGRLLRRRLPDWTADDHMREADDLIAERRRLAAYYDKCIETYLANLAADGIDPGPLISGIVSAKFPDRVKVDLRNMAHTLSDLGGAAAAHYAAAGKRIETFRRAVNG